jgi:hypothetical protein
MAMLSSRLIALVEDHWEPLTSQVILLIRKDPEIVHLSQLPETVLREWGRRILKNLGHWLVESSEAEMRRYYEDVGRNWHREGVPLHETVRVAHILRARMVDFIRQQGINQSTIEVYAEEELEYRVDSFFDCLVYSMVKGCETARRGAAATPAH